MAAGYWFKMYKKSQAQLAELSKKQVEGSKPMVRVLGTWYSKDPAHINPDYIST